MKHTFSLIALLLFLTPVFSQITTLSDDFEGGGTITGWFGDDCGLNASFANPVSGGINTSATVLRYHDTGGQFANVRFEQVDNFDMANSYNFSLKIYVSSSGLTGSSPNQVSLKLQNGTLGSPWTTQCEIIKPIVLDQWQEVTFDFLNDSYINLDAGSPAPTTRTDFNRVVIQVNGEWNFDHVLAYIDDVTYGTPTPPDPDPTTDVLVWSDEFDVDGAVNAANWHHQTQLPLPCGWFNGEIQHYTDRIDNSYVSGGTLKVVAKKENYLDQGCFKQHTSARLNSKFAFTYGRVEIRAKLPTGIGTWPAMWTLGKNINEDGAYWDDQGYGTVTWPACGEIDIMEHWGINQDYVSSALHTPSSFGGTVNVGGRYVTNASTDFHLYEMIWDEDKIVFKVDGITHYTYEPAVKDANTWPFDADQYLILNVAILPDISPAFTSSALEIDYIRVYQELNCTAPTNPTTTIHSPTAATISWDAVPGATGYQITGGLLGGPTKSIKTAANSKTIPVLSPGTTYQWKVRTFCDPILTDYSDQSFFTTPLTREAPQMTIAPNPSKGAVQVQLNGTDGGLIELVDLSGRVVQQRLLNEGSNVASFDGLAKGLYIVRHSGSDGEQRELLVVD